LPLERQRWASSASGTFTHTNWWTGQSRADGVSYYQYLPAWIVDGDPTFETQALDCCAGYTTEVPIGIHRWQETGRWLDVHPMGSKVG